MQLNSSFKDKKNFKCDTPENTISRLERSFEHLGLELELTCKRVSRSINLFWCRIEIPCLGIGSNGKGPSSELAKASALAELVERISSGTFFNCSDYLKNLSSNNEDYSKLLSDLTFLSNFANLIGYVYSTEDDLVNPLTIKDLIRDHDFCKNEVIQQIKLDDVSKHWINSYSLIQEKEIKIPLKFIKLISGSNGLAAGNTLEEAIVQASNEIFERFVCINTLRNQKVLPTIDVQSIPFNSIKRIIRLLNKNKIDVIIKDFSFGNVFPCFGVLFLNNNLKNSKNPLKKALQYRTFRVGSSFNQEEALLRCFTEELQGKSIKYFKKNYLDFLWKNLLKHLDSNYQPKINYIRVFRNYQFTGNLSFLEEGEIKSFAAADELIYDCLEEITKIKGICKSLETDLLVINHTHPSLKFPVVRVVIPRISDILSFYNLKQDSVISFIQKIQNKIYTDLQIDEDFFLKNDWITDEQKLLTLAKELIENIKNTTKLEYTSSGLLLENLNAVRLLASIYYRINDLKHFSVCMRTLSSFHPSQRITYLYLSLLAKFNQTELLLENSKKISECGLFFQDTTQQNPFISWYQKQNLESCKNNRMMNVRKFVDNFISTNKD